MSTVPLQPGAIALLLLPVLTGQKRNVWGTCPSPQAGNDLPNMTAVPTVSTKQKQKNK